MLQDQERRVPCHARLALSKPKPFLFQLQSFGATAKAMTSRWKSHASGPLSGRIRAPGDKSISHRALIFGAMAEGTTEISGLLEGEDVLNTGKAVAAMGAKVERLGEGRWRVVGAATLSSASIDCGNSGTGARLLMGAVAGYQSDVIVDGDASLRSRPMGRVTGPLMQMGARFEGEKLPMTVHGGALKAIRYVLPVASAQVKSAVLLAGLHAAGETEVVEPEPTRDHTERMLRAFGAVVSVDDQADGRHVRLTGGQALKATEVAVPGDPSSAAFPIVAALITPGSRVTVEGVLLNPLRTGLFDTLREMGADLVIENQREESGEPVGDLTAAYSKLKGVEVPPERAPSMIDEYPILAVAAAFAEGDTVMRGIGELRVKESDRIALMAAGLAACGVSVVEEPDGLIVHGLGGAPAGGATVTTKGDHRIAMSHLVLGLAAQAPVTVDEPDMIATSFPGFRALMARLGAAIADA
jgi:3-phosphoshikimate 1-carboxyvinyltransferase